MAQSAVTVTPPSPTPPTNMSFTGATGPNPPNYTRETYEDPVANPPPYFDDGAAGALTAMAANTAALASGTSAADNAGGTAALGAGGTGVNDAAGTYPGTTDGLVPASTSIAHEGAGTEVVVTAPGSRAEAPTQSVSVLGDYTNAPNAQHASSLSPAGAATIASFVPADVAAGVDTFALQVNGTNFTPQSVVYINGVAQATTYVSSIRLDVAAALKRPTAGTYPIMVRTAGIVETAPTNYTYT